ncbi:MAG: DUF2268 domain-containing putative Zn-dependent protease [Candidatus Dormibacteria bacterium]
MQLVFLDTDTYVFTSAERHLVAEVLGGAEAEIRGLLRGSTKRLTVTGWPTDFVIPEVRSGDKTPTKDLIEVSVNPAHPGGVEPVFRTSFRELLFHECHHAARKHLLPDRESTLIDGAVMEGLATAFERDGAGARPLWATYDPVDAAGWHTEMIATPHGRYDDWRYSQTDGCRWISYRVGTHIVDRALTNSGETAASLVAASTADVLRLAGLDRITQGEEDPLL